MPTSPPGGVTDASRQARKEWVQRNPIRAWRYSHTPRLSLLDAADRIGVGMSMIQMYERGVHRPTGARADNLAALIGDDWAQQWDQWLAAKPN